MRVTVTGAGGFIGGHLVNRLVRDGHEVKAVDIKHLIDWHQINARAGSVRLDCSDQEEARIACDGVDWVFNLAADMGGMGFIETNRALCAEDVRTTLTMIQAARDTGVTRYFYASSACIYPAGRQESTDGFSLAEHEAYPAQPEEGYGWAKLYGELLADYFYVDYGLDTRVARFHNIYGTHTAWDGGREKAPAAVCRKIAHAALTGEMTIPVWGDGYQTRSFCWVDDAVEGIMRLMNAPRRYPPLNVGSSECVSIRELYDMVAEIAGITPVYAFDKSAPQGVRGRNSDNALIREVFAWEPSTPLSVGMKELYAWILGEVSLPAVE
jgi:GDP-D-mannose 3',5'-epimerase